MVAVAVAYETKVENVKYIRYISTDVKSKGIMYEHRGNGEETSR